MSRKINNCEKCDGEGWLWWFELENYYGPATETGEDDTRYICYECLGKPDKIVLFKGFDPQI